MKFSFSSVHLFSVYSNHICTIDFVVLSFKKIYLSTFFRLTNFIIFIIYSSLFTIHQSCLMTSVSLKGFKEPENKLEKYKGFFWKGRKCWQMFSCLSLQLAQTHPSIEFCLQQHKGVLICF